MAKKLIMLMGVQRSGTNAVFDSLACDPTLTVFNEKARDEIYDDFMLRPEPEIRAALHRAPGAVMLKPISETRRRGVRDLFYEYAGYEVALVWLFRDPVNVLYSAYGMGWAGMESIVDGFELRQWIDRNEKLLAALDEFGDRVVVVRYEDLVADADILSTLFRRLGVRGKNLMRGDTNAGREELPLDLQERIDVATRDTLLRLDAARTYKPSVESARRAGPEQVPRSLLSVGAGCGEDATLSSRAAWVSRPARSPARVDGLRFWLKTESLVSEHVGTGAATWQDSGPLQIAEIASEFAPRVCSGVANGNAAVRFGTTPSGMSYRGDWSFLADECPFTVFVVFESAPRDGELLRTGAFRLEWSAGARALRGLLRLPDDRPRLDAHRVPASDDRNWEWRAIDARHAFRGERTQLWLCVLLNDDRKEGRDAGAATTAVVDTLELGGVDDRGAPRFVGDIAELVIFDRALPEADRVRVGHYLMVKYGV